MQKLLFLLLTACNVTPVSLDSHIRATASIVIDVGDEIQGQGSGSIISCSPAEPGMFSITVLTAKHVVVLLTNPFAEGKIHLPGLEPVFVQEVKMHPTIDVAILKAKIPSFIVPISLDCTEPVVGEFTWVIGYPRGLGPIITSGYTSIPAIVSGERLNLSSAPVYFGNSGGPVINKGSNKLIGIVSQKLQGKGELIPHLHAFIPTLVFLDWLKVTL